MTEPAGDAPAPADRWALGILAVAAVVYGWFALVVHRTPFYGVETDLLSEYIPRARHLLAGHWSLELPAARGPVYPLLLAAGSFATGGDLYLAARVVNLLAAVAAAAATWALVGRFLGRTVAALALVAMLVAPSFAYATIEAGSDLPALALSLAATLLALRARGAKWGALAGLVAAVAVLTRPNALALLPAAAVTFALGNSRARRALGYLVGAGIPLAAWGLARHLAGADVEVASRDAFNMAIEFYGGEKDWERFGKSGLHPFHSFLDVVRYDPAGFFAHLARNLGTRWVEDARRLLPPVVGWLALPGMLVCWRRRPGWIPMAAHFLFAYAMLALVFYSTRFFLYLMPFYLSGAAALVRLADLRIAGEPTEGARRRWPLASALFGVALIGSAVVAGRELATSFRNAPTETRAAGEALRAIARPGEIVMARKPHVAYFAGIDLAPLPEFGSFAELLAIAKQAHANYLLISPVEVSLRSRLSFLADSSVSLPGLEPIARGANSAGRFYVLYRFTGEVAPPGVFEQALITQLRRFAEARPGYAPGLVMLGYELLNLGQIQDALQVLVPAERIDPKDPEAPRYLALAEARLGDLEGAERDIAKARERGADAAWCDAFLGHVRISQKRYAEARPLLARAVQAAPANPAFLGDLGLACFFDGAYLESADALEKYLGMVPGDSMARTLCVEAWTRAGRADRARKIRAQP